MPRRARSFIHLERLGSTAWGLVGPWKASVQWCFGGRAPGVVGVVTGSFLPRPHQTSGMPSPPPCSWARGSTVSRKRKPTRPSPCGSAPAARVHLRPPRDLRGPRGPTRGPALPGSGLSSAATGPTSSSGFAAPGCLPAPAGSPPGKFSAASPGPVGASCPPPPASAAHRLCLPPPPPVPVQTSPPPSFPRGRTGRKPSRIPCGQTGPPRDS